MKKTTTTISGLIAKLEDMKKESGDAKLYVVHMSDPKEDDTVEFNGLSDTVAMMKIVDGDDTGVLIFQSDEVLKP